MKTMAKTILAVLFLSFLTTGCALKHSGGGYERTPGCDRSPGNR